MCIKKFQFGRRRRPNWRKAQLDRHELKRGHFKPEYAGKLNFYLNVLDDKVKLPHEQPSIGIILCKEKDNTVVEYSVKTIDKAMGVATYKTTSQAPKEIKDILPTPDELAALL